MTETEPDLQLKEDRLTDRVRRAILGAPRDVADTSQLHKMSLIAFLAWVGLGADGLSSSAYGPEEAFRALLGHPELVVAMFVAMVLTVFIISYAYSRIIEHFPSGAADTSSRPGCWGPASGSSPGPRSWSTTS